MWICHECWDPTYINVSIHSEREREREYLLTPYWLPIAHPLAQGSRQMTGYREFLPAVRSGTAEGSWASRHGVVQDTIPWPIFPSGLGIKPKPQWVPMTILVDPWRSLAAGPMWIGPPAYSLPWPRSPTLAYILVDLWGAPLHACTCLQIFLPSPFYNLNSEFTKFASEHVNSQSCNNNTSQSCNNNTSIAKPMITLPALVPPQWQL